MRIDRKEVVTGMMVAMMELTKGILMRDGVLTMEQFNEAATEARTAILSSTDECEETKEFSLITIAYKEEEVHECAICERMKELEVSGVCPMCGASILYAEPKISGMGPIGGQEDLDDYGDDDIKLTETGAADGDKLDSQLPPGYEHIGTHPVLGLNIYKGPNGEIAIGM